MKKIESIPKNDYLDDTKETEKIPFFATSRGKTISALLMIIVIFVVFMTRENFSGDINYALDNEKLGVACINNNVTFIYYDDIKEVNYCDKLPSGETIASEEWDSGFCGKIKSNELDECVVYVYTSNNSCIEIVHNDGVLFFNLDNVKKTQDTYSKIIEKIK